MAKQGSMDAVAGALTVPLTSLDPTPEDSRVVKRALTYDSSREDAQCPFFREKDLAAEAPDGHAPADPAPKEPAQAIDRAPQEPAQAIDQAPCEPDRRSAPRASAADSVEPRGPTAHRTPVKKKSKSHQGSPPESSTPPSSTPPCKPKKAAGKSPSYWRIFVCKRCVVYT